MQKDPCGALNAKRAPFGALRAVNSLDFVEALPAEKGGALRESPTLARRFPVRSRGHTSTSWYLHCPYLKSPTPDHLLSANTQTLPDGSGRIRKGERTPYSLDLGAHDAVGEMVVDDPACLHRGVQCRGTDELETG